MVLTRGNSINIPVSANRHRHVRKSVLLLIFSLPNNFFINSFSGTRWRGCESYPLFPWSCFYDKNTSCSGSQDTFRTCIYPLNHWNSSFVRSTLRLDNVRGHSTTVARNPQATVRKYVHGCVPFESRNEGPIVFIPPIMYQNYFPFWILWTRDVNGETALKQMTVLNCLFADESVPTRSRFFKNLERASSFVTC